MNKKELNCEANLKFQKFLSRLISTSGSPDNFEELAYLKPNGSIPSSILSGFIRQNNENLIYPKWTWTIFCSTNELLSKCFRKASQCESRKKAHWVATSAATIFLKHDFLDSILFFSLNVSWDHGAHCAGRQWWLCDRLHKCDLCSEKMATLNDLSKKKHNGNCICCEKILQCCKIWQIAKVLFSD